MKFDSLNPGTGIDPELIDRYLAGEISAAEREYAEAWIASDIECGRLVQEMRLMQPGFVERIDEPDAEAAVERIAKIRRAVAVNGEYSKVSLPRWVGYGTVAASCVLAIVLWQLLQSGADTRTLNTQGKVYTTRAGQRASLTLSDGAHVTLGPSTTLRVRNTEGTTDVEVDGEALFRVKHAAQHPFVVTSHGVTTRVLGTEFVVRAYDASLIRVAVREGRVSVQSPALTISNAGLVNAGEAASVSANVPPVIAPIADFATEFSWANGELTLHNMPLGDAVVRLSRWYNVEFRVEDPALLQRRVSGSFPNNFSMAVMQELARVIEANVAKSANTLTFSTKR